MSTSGGSDSPTEEELREAYEAEIKKVRLEHLLLDQVVTLVNLGMRRTGLAAGTEEERDPEQVRLAIDAIRALVPLLERSAPQQVGPIRDALSQLQLAFVKIGGAASPSAAPQGREAPGGSPPASEAGAPRPADEPDPGSPAGETRPPRPGEPGPAQRSGRLWVPGQR